MGEPRSCEHDLSYPEYIGVGGEPGEVNHLSTRRNMAMDAYAKMCACCDPSETAKIRSALLEYCKVDTLGMVRIVEALREKTA